MSKYKLPLLIFIALVIVVLSIYFITSFSSVNESIAELKKNPNVKEAWFSGDQNILHINCKNGKQLTVELEEGIGRFDPISADFCS
jgi:flagellar basal body-associated protein FliL